VEGKRIASYAYTLQRLVSNVPGMRFLPCYR